MIDGESRRFCQKCTRFHGVNAFEGAQRSCRAQLLKGMLKQTPKRARVLKSTDGAKGSEGVESTQPEDTQDPPSSNVNKRHRATKAPAAAVVATHSLDSREDTPMTPPVPSFGVAHESTLDLCRRSNSSNGSRGSSASQHSSTTSLVDDVADDVFEALEEEREESRRAQARAWTGADAGMGAGAEELMVNNLDPASILTTARATIQTTNMGFSTDDALAKRDSMGFLPLPSLAFNTIDQTVGGLMGSVEHRLHQQQKQRRYHHQQQQQLLRRQQQEQHHLRQQQQRLDFGIGISGSGGGTGGGVGFGADDSACYEDFVRVVSGIDVETDETHTVGRLPTGRGELGDVLVLMQQEASMGQGQHCSSNINYNRWAGSGAASVHHDAQTFTDAFAGASTERFHHFAPELQDPDPAPELQDPDSLDMLTLWAKLDGFSPSDFPTEGLAPELHRWLQHKTPAAMSGHIQPGCTLLTVDCLLPLGDASQIRADGVHALADSLLAGPLVRVRKLPQRTRPK